MVIESHYGNCIAVISSTSETINLSCKVAGSFTTSTETSEN